MNWLFSYMWSGSNYIRYCIEYLTKKPTQGPVRLIEHNQKYVLFRSHYVLDTHPNSKISLLIRNPIELALRKSLTDSNSTNPIENIHSVCGRYLSFIQRYPNSHIIYYEDLLDSFDVVKNLIDFYEIPLVDSLSDFEEKLDYHKQKSYELGNPYLSDSSKMFYSRMLDESELRNMKSEMKNYSQELNQILSRYFT